MSPVSPAPPRAGPSGSGAWTSLAGVWRTAMKPKWLALLAAVLVVLVLFATLGLWQLDVARDRNHAEAVERARALPPVALTDALSPHATMPGDLAGRTVTLTGSYEPQRQLIITDRRLHGEPGYWVVTPVVVEPGGARLAVVRGFTADPSSVPPPQPGPVRFTGMLAPGESAPNDPVALPAGRMQTVDLAVLVNEWPGRLYNAMLFPTSQTPAAGTQPAHIPPPDFTADGFAWRNLAYALQWWIFALFALYMWWRMVREEHQRLAFIERGATPPGGAPGHDRDEPDEQDEPDEPDEVDPPEHRDRNATKERT